MHIGQLMRSLIGDLRVQEAKTLELRVGQIVRGTLLQMLSDSEALLQLEGMQIRARLQAPLQPGQSTWLQVMSPSTAGEILLKPVDMPVQRMSEQAIGALLKSLGLEDTEANRKLLAMMQREGVELSKTNVRDLARIVQQAPAEADGMKWMQAAVLARSRGLPLTETAIRALQQVLFGPPFTKLMQQLESEASAFRDAFAHQAPKTDPALSLRSIPRMLDNMGQAIQQMRALLSGVAGQHAATGGGGEAAALGAPSLPNPAGATAARSPSGGHGPAAGGGATGIVSGQATAHAQPGAAAVAGGMAPSSGANGPVQTPTPASAGASSGTFSASAPLPADNSGSGGAQMQIAPATAHVAETAGRMAEAQPQPERTPGEWIPRLLRMLGVETEHSLLKQSQMQAAESGVRSAVEQGRMPILQQPLQEAVPFGQEAFRPGAGGETFKMVLMQLSSAADELPAGLKETVQQTLQHITGQQLLLGADRGSAFTHFTLFLPLEGGQRDYPSAIHIQSRKKGSKGEIDADNCRLVFDLSMKHLGDTLIDVHVFERTIQLHVFNDHPLLGGWLEEARPQLDEAFRQIGYRMASVKCSPFPQMQASGGDDGKRETASKVPASLDYAPKPYKGVDLRI